MARKPDSPSGRPVRRLARLNEGKWDPAIDAKPDFDQGVFGHVLDRAPGMRFTDIRVDRDGNRYEDPDTTTREPSRSRSRSGNPDEADDPKTLFVGSVAEIEKYAEAVLRRYKLPTPAEPGIYWEDDATGLLRWGPKAPSDLWDRMPFNGLYEPMASKFVEENIDRWPNCWEAPLASAYLDLRGQIGTELDRVRARFEDAAHDRNVSPLSGVRRRSNREPLDFPDWAFDNGYYFGQMIGELTERWRLGLLHGQSLLHDHRRRDAVSVTAATDQRHSDSVAWKREAVLLARSVSADRAKISTKALSAAATARRVIDHAARLSKSPAASNTADEEDRRAAQKRLAGLKPETVAAPLRKRLAEWCGSSQAESPDDRSS